MTLRDAVIAYRDDVIVLIERCTVQLSALDPDDAELRAGWLARRTWAENSRDRLAKMLEETSA
jgi:hypothetical protein